MLLHPRLVFCTYTDVHTFDVQNFTPLGDVERGRSLLPRRESKVYTVPDDLKEDELDAGTCSYSLSITVELIRVAHRCVEISFHFDKDNDATYLDDLNEDKLVEERANTDSVCHDPGSALLCLDVEF